MFDVTQAAIDYLESHLKKEGIEATNSHIRLYMAAG